MDAIAEYQTISPTTLADVLGREHVLDGGIRPLWSPMPRVAGPAFTVRCAPGDPRCRESRHRRRTPRCLDVERPRKRCRPRGHACFGRQECRCAA
jgi:regulator of RNase E activity RraA